MNKDKYAIYLRKSRADLELEALGEGETLARHSKMLYDLAAKHDISTDQITVYREVVSGDSIQERPQMQRLLSDVYGRKYKAVLVVEIERLARGNTKDQGEVADAFQYSKTYIITPSKVYDPENESDQEYFEFGLFMSRREFKTIRRRLEAGKTQSVMEGNYLLPQRTFGYDIVRETKKDRHLVINPEEAKIVHMIFDWYTIDRWSTWKIAQTLSEMGIKTSTGGTEWARGTVLKMLTNEIYIGLIVWGKFKTTKVFDAATGKTTKKRIKTPQNEWIIAKGKHDPIISQEQFDAAQELAKAKAPVNTALKMVNPFAGLVVCSGCGKHIVYGDTKRINTSPRLIHPQWGKCRKKSVAYNLFVESVIDALRAYIEDSEMKIENGTDQTELIRHQEKIQTMEKELSKLEARKRRLFDSWEAEDGTYTRDEFIERKQMYTHQIDVLKDQIDIAKKEAPSPVDYEEQITTLHRLINCIKDNSIEAEEKNAFLKQFISRIEYDAIDLGSKRGAKLILDIHLK